MTPAPELQQRPVAQKKKSKTVKSIRSRVRTKFKIEDFVIVDE